MAIQDGQVDDLSDTTRNCPGCGQIVDFGEPCSGCGLFYGDLPDDATGQPTYRMVKISVWEAQQAQVEALTGRAGELEAFLLGCAKELCPACENGLWPAQREDTIFGWVHHCTSEDEQAFDWRCQANAIMEVLYPKSDPTATDGRVEGDGSN